MPSNEDSLACWCFDEYFKNSRYAYLSFDLGDFDVFSSLYWFYIKPVERKLIETTASPSISWARQLRRARARTHIHKSSWTTTAQRKKKGFLLSRLAVAETKRKHPSQQEKMPCDTHDSLKRCAWRKEKQSFSLSLDSLSKSINLTSALVERGGKLRPDICIFPIPVIIYRRSFELDRINIGVQTSTFSYPRRSPKQFSLFPWAVVIRGNGCVS